MYRYIFLVRSSDDPMYCMYSNVLGKELFIIALPHLVRCTGNTVVHMVSEGRFGELRGIPSIFLSDLVI